MQVDIQELNPVKKLIRVKLPKSRVEQEFDTFLGSAQKNATVKGFRPGQAPKDVLRKSLGDKAKQEVASRLIHSSMLDTIREHNLAIVGDPILTENFRQNDKRKFPGNFSLDGSFSFEVETELQPTLSTVNYQNIKIKQAIPTVEELVDIQLNSARKLHASPEPVSRPAQIGDHVLIDFSGTIDGNQFSGSSQTLYTVEVGVDHYIPGFSEHFLGKNESEQFTFKMVLPQVMKEVELRGKEATYECMVYSVSQLNLPAVDDELAKLCFYENLEAMKEAFKLKAIETELPAEKAKHLEEISKTLISNNSFDCPQIWIKNESNMIMSRLGIKEEPQGDIKKSIMEMAERSVRRSFILDKIYENEPAIHLSIPEVHKLLEKEGSKINKTAEEILTYLKNNNRYESFMSYHQQIRTVDYLLSNATVESSV